MKLKTHIQTQNKTYVEYATETGLSLGAIKKYLTGERYPCHHALKKIFIKSKGAVEPNDFYPVDEWRKELE